MLENGEQSNPTQMYLIQAQSNNNNTYELYSLLPKTTRQTKHLKLN